MSKPDEPCFHRVPPRRDVAYPSDVPSPSRTVTRPTLNLTSSVRAGQGADPPACIGACASGLGDTGNQSHDDCARNKTHEIGAYSETPPRWASGAGSRRPDR